MLLVSLTPRFSEVVDALVRRNRFSGFDRLRETAEAVHGLLVVPNTLLKQGC